MEQVVLSGLAVFATLIALIAFIFKLQIRINNEYTFLYNRERKPMVSVSEVKIPFMVKLSDDDDDNSSRGGSKKKTDSLSLHIEGAMTGLITYFCGVALAELDRNIKQNMGGERRSFTDILNLLSLWSSKKEKLLFGEDNKCKHAFKYSDLPQDVKKSLDKIINENLSSSKSLAPFAVQVEIEETSGMESNSDIVSVVSVFDIKGNSGNYEVTTQYIETADKRILPMKKLYSSGVTNNTDNPSRVNQSEPSELCVVCQQFPVTRTILPCRHSCTCKLCFKELETCPICRARVEAFFLVRNEASMPISAEEEQSKTSNDIVGMGFWDLIKSVWNAS